MNTLPKAKRYLVSCDAGGILYIGKKNPRGALPVAYVSEDDIGQLHAHCRLAYDNKTYLVPGIPEAADQIAGIDALERFRDRISKAGITTPL